jgi:hypothetical protein
MGLSEPVQAAIPQALEMIESLVRDLLSEKLGAATNPVT